MRKKMFTVQKGSEAHKALSEIMSQENPPKTVGELRDALTKWQERQRVSK